MKFLYDVPKPVGEIVLFLELIRIICEGCTFSDLLQRSESRENFMD
jgi:hypothetical protein